MARSDLVTGNVKSCGCLRRDLPTQIFKGVEGGVSYNTLYNRCKRGAKTRGIEFTLTPEQHKALTQMNCHYSGHPPKPFNAYNLKQQSNMTTTSVKQAWIVMNGIDRRDPNKGYTVENCVPCCEQCNYAKLDYTEDEYVNHCREVVVFQDSKDKSETTAA